MSQRVGDQKVHKGDADLPQAASQEKGGNIVTEPLDEGAARRQRDSTSDPRIEVAGEDSADVPSRPWPQVEYPGVPEMPVDVFDDLSSWSSSWYACTD